MQPRSERKRAFSLAGEKDFQRRLELIERGIRELEATADAGLRATAQQLVQSLLELHAASLERLLEIVHDSGTGGQEIIDTLGRDTLVSKLLVLHSLHPLPLEARVLGTLEDLRPSLRSSRADVELLSVIDGTVRVRIHGGAGLTPMVERAILDAAPDVTTLVVEGTAETAAVVGFVPLASLRGTEPLRSGPPHLPALVPAPAS